MVTLRSAEAAREYQAMQDLDQQDCYSAALDREIERISESVDDVLMAMKEIDDIDQYERACVQRDYATSEFERKQGAAIKSRIEYDAICELAKKNLKAG